MFLKIYSGGQCGVDQAALFAAYVCGLPTGGYATKTFKTLEGDNPSLLRDVFKLVALQTNNYKERTWKNVEESDCTLRFATHWDSPGEKCTLNAIKRFDKEYFDVDFNELDMRFHGSELSAARRKVLDFIKDRRIVNVAGNSQETSPGICANVVEFLIPIFRIIKNNESSSSLPSL